jgi:hypothetical protein
MTKIARKSEMQSTTCENDEAGFCPAAARTSRDTCASVVKKESKKKSLNTSCTSKNPPKIVQLKNSTGTCCQSTQANAKDLRAKSRQCDIQNNEGEKLSTGYNKCYNDSAHWCVFHGATTFRVITSTSPFFPFCVNKKRLSNCLLCLKCCIKLEMFINEAKLHNCTIEKIDYPIWSNERNEKESKRIVQAQDMKKGSVSFTGLSTKSSFMKDQFRVQVMCGKLHRFLLTEAHLNMNLWCPFCVLSEKNHSNGKCQTKQWNMSQQFNAQKLQKELFESAKSSFLQNVQKDSQTTTFPQCKILPPSFTKPLASLSMKILKPSFSGSFKDLFFFFIERIRTIPVCCVFNIEGRSLNFLSCETAQKNMIHSLAMKDMALHKKSVLKIENKEQIFILFFSFNLV